MQNTFAKILVLFWMALPVALAGSAYASTGTHFPVKTQIVATVDDGDIVAQATDDDPPKDCKKNPKDPRCKKQY